MNDLRIGASTVSTLAEFSDHGLKGRGSEPSLLAEPTSPAWLLTIATGVKVSVAASDVIYIYPELPPVFAIPQTPAHVLGVLNWQQSLVPVIDLGRHWGLQSEPNCAASQSVMVLLMLADTRLGAMALEQIPERVMVADSSQCELPASLEPWQALTASCFMDASHGAVPILDLNAVFGGG